jgi:uncharacterized membrane protein YhaH (DUF805 family)
LPWIIGNLAVTTRRLHDLKQSAWMQIVPMAIGGVALSVMLGTDAHHQFQLNDLLAMDTPVEKARAGLAVLTVILSIAFSAWLGFAPGTKGPNCYGEADPV